MKIDNVHKLFHFELKDVYDAEKRLTKAIPKMAKAAESENLQTALEDHLKVTLGHVERLEQVFEAVGEKPSGKPCEAMKGLIAEGEEGVGANEKGLLRDLLIIGSARRVEHYEMACYLTLIALAESLDLKEVQDLLRTTLEEEQVADDTLDNLFDELVAQSNVIEATAE